MTRLLTAALIVLSLTAMAACSSARRQPSLPVPDSLISESRMTGPAQTRQAMIYRTSGNYADNVPVQIRPSGQLLSYPAPTDITEDSEPIPLIDGWLLDRCGVSLDSRFTSYSWAVYRRLTTPPTPAQIMANLIPGARVTEVRTLPMTPAEAAADPRAVMELIRTRALTVTVDTTRRADD